MTDEEIKYLLKKYVKRVGSPKAVRSLILAGISPSSAEKLAGARYESETGLLMRAAITRMLNDGRRRAG